MTDFGEGGELDLSSPTSTSPDNKPKYPLMARFWVEFQKSWNPILILLLFLVWTWVCHFSSMCIFFSWWPQFI